MNAKDPIEPRARPSLRHAVCWALVLSSMISTPVLSAQTDISSSPITSTNAAQVKPNIMLLFHSSGSMGWGHMPNEMESEVGIGSIGYKAAQCNVVYYNPSLTYALPKQADGTPFATPSFTGAFYDGYATFDGTTPATVDLSQAFKAYDDNTLRTSGYNDTPQPAYYYTYTPNSGTAPIAVYDSAPCTDGDVNTSVPSNDGPAPNGGTWAGNWTRVVVGSNTGVGGSDERQNFAIWYSYYRTRILMVKTAASLAFTPLTDSFRVGFITVKPKNNPTDVAINPNAYLQISDFDTTQRGLWFSKMFSQVPRGSTPMREALARVGRMYAGKHDGINQGMNDDPVQYSCQQNFTIMTSNGYWNGQEESTPQGSYLGGPVDISGQALVGQQDGSLNANTTNNPSPPPATDFNGTPRPIWDGTFDGLRTITDKTVAYAYAPCGTYFNKTTTQLLQSTSQLQQTTSQTTQSTLQTLQSTTETLQSTLQTLQSTSQTAISTIQNLVSTQQNLQSTTQMLYSTSQWFQTTSKNQQTVWTPLRSTVQNLQSTVQNLQTTSQQTQQTIQALQSTRQALSSTTQVLQSTSQMTQTTSQVATSTSQIFASTSQLQITTSQVRKSTSQTRSCDGTTELCTPAPVGNCVTGGDITCEVVATGPTLVASCTNDPESQANHWTTTTCVTSGTGPTPIGACTPSPATSQNTYTTTTCNTVPTGPTAVATCVDAPANYGNSYIATTCSVTSTGPTFTASCVPTAANSTNSYITTTCAPTSVGPVGVSSCSPASPMQGNSYTTITCTPVNTTNVPVASCVPANGDNTNGYTTTTCISPNNTTNVPVAACTNSPGTNLNAWTTTVCSYPNNTSNVPVASCTPSSASSTNYYTWTFCGTNNSAQIPTGSCTPVSADNTNAYTATICPVIVNPDVPVATCTASGPSSSNFWVDTTCPAAVVTTNIPVPSCTNAAASSNNSWTMYSCSNNNTTSVPVNSCLASGPSLNNSWTTTTCPPEQLDSGPTTVQSCVASPATDMNDHQRTDCSVVIDQTNVQMGTCVPDPASASNGYVQTSCSSQTTPWAPIASCTPQTAQLSNGWVEIDCAPNNTTAVPVATCTPSGPSSTNGWTTTTCPPPNVTVPTAVASCTPIAADDTDSYISTICPPPNVTGPTASGTCVPDGASNTNQWTTTTCPTLLTGPVGVSSCTPAMGNGTNGWMTTTCTPNNSTNVAVASCTPSGPTSTNGYMTTTCLPNNTSAVPVLSCTPSAPRYGNQYTTTTCASNNQLNVPVPAGSCTPSGPSANSYITTTCPTIVVPPYGVSACTPSGPTQQNGYTTTTCPGVATTGPISVASCASSGPTIDNGYTTTVCSPVNTGPVVVTSCNPSGANQNNGYVTTTCSPLDGDQETVTTYTRVQQFDISGGAQSSTGTDVTTTDGPNATGACYAPGTQPALPANGEASWGSADATAYPSCTGWPCQVDTNGGNPRSINSLADVAQYYYVHDLRPATSWPSTISADNVPAVGAGLEDDKARWQHMTTFAISLGVSGTIKYVSDYKTSAVSGATDSPPDIRFADIRVGTDTAVPPNVANWPLWPDPSLDYSNDDNYISPRSIDDFWHSAVNGRGLYFSAGNPTSVIAGLAGALAGITSRVASSTGAGTSNLEPVTGDNFVYLANYTTQKWTGDVQAHEIDVNTGVIQTPTIWSAQSLLDAKVSNACDNRKIMLFRSGASNNLVNFSWNTLACDGAGNPTGTADTGLNAAEQANFSSTNVSLLSQYPSMTDGTSGTVDQRTPASGANLVNFLRGQRGMENFVTNVAGKLYRGRDHVLGDVVDGQPVYVRAPFATYSDTGYTAFALANASRTPMLYVAANDGMLHAFYAGTSETDPLGGKEAWAVVPSAMLPNLYTLADTNYQNVHRYFVDGTPSVSDVYDGTNWRTLLVGGFNDGGRGFYALDVTDPIHPKGMWEFNWSSTACPSNPSAAAGNTADCHVGLSFGRPVISKLNDGSWVVMVTSGYNNINANPQSGDGGGYLYVLNAVTGQIIYKIPTNVGNATTPSGLAQINNFVDKADVNNLTDWVYGTDLLGNIWRFDVNDNLPPAGREASLVGTATDSTGTPQPITTRPELTQLGDKPMILVATGELLGATDVSNLQTQSVYGFIDPLTGSPAYANLRSALAPLTMAQVGSGTGAYRTIACMGSTAACASSSGWRIDLPDPGERVNVGMKLSSSTLVVGSNVPQISACSAGGYSWLNYLNFSTGLAVSTSANVSVSEQVANSLIVGLTVVKLPSGALKAIVTTSDAGVLTQGIPVGSGSTNAKRVSWREIVSQ